VQSVVIDGASGTSLEVISGVSHAGVNLGPLYDLPTEISSIIRQYANDVIIYRLTITTEDVLQLQLDLEILSLWAKDWFYQNVNI